MKTLTAEATVAADGSSLIVPSIKSLALKPGEKVVVVISTEQYGAVSSTKHPLRGTVRRYDNPFEPAIPADEWEAST